MNNRLDKDASRQSNICLPIINYIFFNRNISKKNNSCFRLSFKTQSWIEYFGRYTDIKKCLEKSRIRFLCIQPSGEMHGHTLPWHRWSFPSLHFFLKSPGLKWKKYWLQAEEEELLQSSTRSCWSVVKDSHWWSQGWHRSIASRKGVYSDAEWTKKHLQ